MGREYARSGLDFGDDSSEPAVGEGKVSLQGREEVLAVLSEAFPVLSMMP
jgi:hypothetical protein